MTPHCPEPKKLAAYAHGELTEPASSEIADHVEQCGQCEATVVNLERQGDTVISSLRKKPAADPLLEEPQCQRAVELVRELGRDPATVDLARGAASSSATSEAAALGQLREYKLLEKLGEGGMGAVYKAMHTKLKRVVALKVLPAERLQDPHALTRFEREMEAVGKLDHPHIVRAMDAGEFNGTHFLVMEYVEGVDLSQLVKQRGPLPIAEACELIRQAAVGLQHAHEHGLVHRDIKPSNLMLASGHRLSAIGQKDQTSPPADSRQPTADSPTVKILDLGLALLSDKQAEGSPRELTNTGQMMGTLDYMAPEQGSDSHIVDIRADIYSLGATLYKLLTGDVIYSGERYKTPVQKMMALATQPAPDVRARRKDVPESLAQVIARMLEKEPAKRPATPAEVAALLAPFAVVGRISNPSVSSDAAHIQGANAPRSPAKPPIARAPGAKPAPKSRVDLPPVIAVKLRPTARPHVASPPAKQLAAARRNLPPWLIVGVLLGLGGFALAVPAVWVIIRNKQGEEVARVQVPEGGSAKIEGADVGNEITDPPAVPNVEAAEDVLPSVVAGAPISPLALVARPAKLPGVRSWTLETKGHRGGGTSVTGNKDGTLFATAGSDGTIRIFQARDGKLLRILETSLSRISCVRWHPHHDLVACVTEDSNVVEFWNPVAGRFVDRIKLPQAGVLCLAWSRSGAWLATGRSMYGEGPSLAILDFETKRLAAVSEGHSVCVHSLSWAGDDLLAVGHYGHRSEVWRWKEGALARVPNEAKAENWWVALSPDGSQLARSINGGGDAVEVVDATTFERIWVSEPLDYLRSLVWSADGAQIYIARGTSGIYAWNAKTGTMVGRELNSGINGAELQPFTDGRLLEIDVDGSAHVLSAAGVSSLATSKGQIDIGHYDARSGVLDWNGVTNCLAVGGTESLTTWDLDSLARKNLVSKLSPLTSLSSSRDGQWLAAGDIHTHFNVYAGDEQSLHMDEVAGNHNVYVSFSPNGKQIATTCPFAPKVMLWDTATKKMLWENEVAKVWPLTWSPDGKHLVGGGEPEIYIWSIDQQQPLKTLHGKDRCLALAWSPDGQTLAAVEDGGRKIRLWDAANWRPLGLLPGHTADINALGWSADGSQLISASVAGQATTWDVAEERAVRTIQLPLVGNGTFDAGAQRLAIASDCEALLFDAATGERLATLAHLRDGRWLAISPTGNFKGPPRIEQMLVYVVELDSGEQVIFSPAEFKKRFGWRNDPSKLLLTGSHGADGTNPGKSKTEILKSFAADTPTVDREGITREAGGWKIVATGDQSVRLFRVEDPGVDNCLVVYRAKVKTQNVGKVAYQSMIRRMPDDPKQPGVYISEALQSPINGTTDWTTREISFQLEKGQRPDLIQLNFSIEGGGTAWIKDVELLKRPLPEDYSSALAADYDRFAIGEWKPAFDTVDRVPQERGVSLDDGVVTLDDVMIRDNSPDAVQATDMIVRAQVKGMGSIATRMVNGSYGFWLGEGFLGINHNDKDGNTVLASRQYEVDLKEFHELALATVGNRQIAFVDGRRVLDTDDDRWNVRGPIVIHAHQTKSEFKNVEVMSLDGLDAAKLLPERDPLAKQVGMWDTEWTLKVAGKPDVTKKGQMLVAHTGLADFYSATSTSDDGSSSLYVYKYLPETNAIRTWTFFSSGHSEVFDKAIDPVTGDHTVPPRPRNGGIDTGSMHFVDENNIEVRFKLTAADGKILAESIGHNKRRDPSRPSTKPSIAAAGPAQEVPELAVLAPFVGRWDVDVQIKPSQHAPDGQKLTKRDEMSWVLGGRFMMGEGYTAEGQLENVWFWSYDPQAKAYAMTMFQHTGDVPVWKNIWNERTKSHEGIAKNLPEGWAGIGGDRIVDENTIDTWVTIKDARGEVMFDMTATKRRK